MLVKLYCSKLDSYIAFSFMYAANF